MVEIISQSPAASRALPESLERARNIQRPRESGAGRVGAFAERSIDSALVSQLAFPRGAAGAAAAPEKSEDLEREVQRLNRLLGSNTAVRFAVNRETGKTVIAIVDTRTDQVLKTIPPGEAHSLDSKLILGSLLVDKKS